MAQIRSASSELTAFFNTGDIPTSDNFSDLILSTAVYDGTLKHISGSTTSTGSFGFLKVVGNVGCDLTPSITNYYTLGSTTFKYSNLHISGTADVPKIANVSGSIASNTTISVSSSLTPTVDNTWNLGEGALRWKTIKGATGSFGMISSSLIPRKNNEYDLGSSTHQWKDLYVDGTAYIDTIDNASAVHIVTASFDYISSSLIPHGDDAYDLGSSGNEWKDLYVDGTAYIDTLSLASLANDINISSISCSAQMLNVSGTIHPKTDNTYDLGTSALQWKDLYVDGIAYIDQISGSGTAGDAYLTASVHIVPGVNDVYTLGNQTNQFLEVFANSVSSSLVTSSIAKIGEAQITTLNASGVTTLDGNVTLGNATGDDITITGRIAADIDPKTDNTYDLGASGLEYKDIYIDGIAYIDQISGSGTAGDSALTSSVHIVPGVDDTYSLGSSALEWKDLYIDGTANLDTAVIGTGSIDRLSATVIPTANNSYNLGSSDFKFATIHTVTASISGYVSSSLIPHSDDTYDLGSSGNEWKDLYIDGTANIDNLNADILSTSLSASINLATFTTSGSAGSSYVSAIRFRNLPTTEAQARLIGTGSLYLGGPSGSNSNYLVVFTG
jgi:hypothetical protein